MEKRSKKRKKKNMKGLGLELSKNTPKAIPKGYSFL
jgi:hypothetical protein